MSEKTSYLTGLSCHLLTADYDSETGAVDPACGTYLLDRAVIDLLDDDLTKKRKLASVLAQKLCRGFRNAIRVVITLEEFRPPPGDQYVTDTLDNLLSQYPASPVQIFEESLYNISCLINHPSELIDIAEQEQWLLYAYDGKSARYMIDQLIKYGYLNYTNKNTSQGPFIIESKGWEFLSSLRNAVVKDSNQGFVAMWFEPSMDKFFHDGFHPAIENGTEYKCIKIDLKQHNNKICDEIISEIRRSKFLVADCSGDRSNVYYEAGFAAGLGIPVIWTVHKDHVKNLQFDTRQYNHIIYETAEELRDLLSSRIRATII